MLGGDGETAPGLGRGALDKSQNEDGGEAGTHEWRPWPAHA